jgi:hypothetical protein
MGDRVRARCGLVPLIAVVAASCLAGTAEAACTASEITGITYTSTSLAPYNPFTSFTPKLVTVTVSATSACAVEVAFYSPSMPARMSGPGGPDLFAYDVQSQGGGTSLLYGGGTPSSTAHIDIGAGNVGSATVEISVPAGQVVADGLYSDADLVAHVFDKTGSTFTLLRTAAMTVNGSVAKVCQFTTPTSPTLNFTSAIANGQPNPAHVQSVTFTGVSCTAPTLVRLSGDRMQLSPPGASSGFDSFINYRASASFNAASAVLNTNLASEASSGTANTTTGATVDGSISVDVNLLAGQPLLAGSYAATLTLAIEPSP